MLLLQHPIGVHPLDESIARWLPAVVLLPVLGAFVTGVIAMLSEWRPGPYDPDPIHTGEFSIAELSGKLPPHGADIHDDGGEEGAPHSHPAPPHPRFVPVSIVGTGVMFAAFGLAVAIFFAMRSAPSSAPLILQLFEWMPAGTAHIDVSFQLDQLSIVMTLVITGVGALIHLFSIGYMRTEPAYARYFAYLNLFVFFMLLLVLGANYPLVFVGWEGVGLCSYLLIGFWYTERANASAGRKAFVVNRIGDLGFLIAMFLMFWNFGSLDFGPVADAARGLPVGSSVATWIALFLLLACAGKSAQIPLYVWLPDAMAGPTPVSALIHAATMVTAGVYLVARSSTLFAAAPVASLTVVAVGALTAAFAASIGLKQWDIKKVLAYSTVSQLGYMFVGVGVGAYAAGVFHLITHAFFKALLFLGAGAVIHAMHDAYHQTDRRGEDAQDMRNMGGLGRYLPVTRVTMWIATLAIAGIPPFAGFFSKDEILGAVFAHANGSTLADVRWLGIPGSIVLYAAYALSLGAALLTAVYMTRMMLYTFHGPNRTGEAERAHLHEVGWTMTVPLIILAAATLVGGWINLPAFAGSLGPPATLTEWLDPVVGAASRTVTRGIVPEVTPSREYTLIGAAVAVGLLGIAFAVARLKPARLVAKRDAKPETGFAGVLAHKYYVDEMYDAALVRPMTEVSRGVLWKGIDIGLVDNLFVNGSTWLARGAGWLGSRLQSGLVGTYAWVLVIGVVTLLGAFTLR
ncbi:MAG: NADH-quinone oxidoreductase subunit L [Gemmatimonadaceae bacterium]